MGNLETFYNSDSIVEKLISKVSADIKIFDQKYNEFTEFTFVNDYILKYGLDQLIKNNLFKGEDLLKVLWDFITGSLSERKEVKLDLSQKEFLNYVYEYILSFSFPKSVGITFEPAITRMAELFMSVYKHWIELSLDINSQSFEAKHRISFLSKQEELELTKDNEYFLFKTKYKEDLIYPLMTLNRELKGHSSLEHISGVSFLALHVARQLKSAGIPIDLGSVAAAAIGHDIGKFGCKKNEEKRVPYLHYYYTSVWFRERSMNYVGNIAANHSTWDLELENLAAESLVLIYADFRVKNKGSNMFIYDLEESFNVILDKLDNVDEKKHKRYKRVYEKLEDFQNFMLALGININDDNKKSEIRKVSKLNKNIELVYGEGIIRSFKNNAIEYNINILNNFSSEEAFNEMLMNLSGEKDWMKLREYLSMFEEYYIYTSQSQKLYLLNVLKELTLFKEEDVRNQAASLMGMLISTFDEEYRKEIPEDTVYNNLEVTGETLFEKYLNWFIYKDVKLTDRHRGWLELNVKNFAGRLFKQLNNHVDKYYAVLEKIYIKAINDEFKNSTKATLCELLKHVALEKVTNPEKTLEFLKKSYLSEDRDIALSSGKSLYVILNRLEANNKYYKELVEFVSANCDPTGSKVIDFVKGKIYQKFISNGQCHNEIIITRDDISTIYLKNLKSATSWIEKKANIDLILELTLSQEVENNLQTVMHFCNLLKVSYTESVRNHSGKAILKIFDMLSSGEKNEACIELIRALEMQDLQFTKYIPRYIGKLLIQLENNEIDEILDDFYDKVKTANTQIAWLVLVAVGFATEEYLQGCELKYENVNYLNRLDKMLGILLVGLYNFDSHLSHESLKIISGNIFSSKELNLKEKKVVFDRLDKKILNIIHFHESDDSRYLRNAASLNAIYRFVSDYEFFESKILVKKSPKIAYFPGTFDPFSLGHKEIAKAIRDLGYDVYLSVDEFSWSKKTQPNKVRRKIILVSIAEELGIYPFPEDIQINIARAKDLDFLRTSFDDRDISIVVGSDVIFGASSYQNPNNRIYDFNHVIFYRKSSNTNEYAEEKKQVHNKLSNIKGSVELLSLAEQYEDVSSTQIRNSIDEDRDIRELIDPLAQKFIYQNGLYKKEPRYKSMVEEAKLETEIVEEVEGKLLKELISNYFVEIPEKIEEIVESLKTVNHLRLILVRDEDTKEVMAFSTSGWLRSTEYYHQFQDKHISDYIRKEAIGRILFVNSMWVNEKSLHYNLHQIIITETLALGLEKDYTFCIYKNKLKKDECKFNKTLELQGFQDVPEAELEQIKWVNMTNPIVLNLDLRSILKRPFRGNNYIRSIVYKSREALQLQLVNLFKGSLVLSFDRNMTYTKLIKKVCEINNVPNYQVLPRKLGENMCAPYGAILSGALAPNTVTKSLHTERIFSSDLGSFKIGEFPNYMTMKNQVKLLSSFERPVILIDDILHKGHRIKALAPLFKEEGVEVKKMVVAILSGLGKELMEIQNSEVEHIYFLPNLRNWFNENAMYPFMGGDYVYREGFDGYILPSINFILPYASPGFINETDPKNIYTLSEVCLLNAIEIFEAIEKEYQILNERTFSIRKLGEVFLKPRKPDYGRTVEMDMELKPSEYLKNDLEKLRRIKKVIIR